MIERSTQRNDGHGQIVYQTKVILLLSPASDTAAAVIGDNEHSHSSALSYGNAPRHPSISSGAWFFFFFCFLGVVVRKYSRHKQLLKSVWEEVTKLLEHRLHFDMPISKYAHLSPGMVSTNYHQRAKLLRYVTNFRVTGSRHLFFDIVGTGFTSWGFSCQYAIDLIYVLQCLENFLSFHSIHT